MKTHPLREEVQQATHKEQAEILRDLLRFPLPQELFIAWAECTPTVPLEFCILHPDTKEILLFLRRLDDAVEEFQGKWHVTGGVQLYGETTSDVWRRLSAGPKYDLSEAHFETPIELPYTQDTQKGSGEEGKCPRGQERNIIHAVIYREGSVGKGEWFSLNDLPSNILGHHKRYLNEIVLPWVLENL